MLKCSIKFLYEAGEKRQSYYLKRDVFIPGWFRLHDTLEGGYNRVVKLAEFRRQREDRLPAYVLYDAEVVWCEARMTVKGIQHLQTTNGIQEVRQSWLLLIAGQEQE